MAIGFLLGIHLDDTLTVGSLTLGLVAFQQVELDQLDQLELVG